MGHTYTRNPATGRMVLCCDACGGWPARAKRCPVGYCPGADLCPKCWQADRGAHADCPRLHREYLAEQVEKAAHPTEYARAAWGDWHEKVPAGMVGVVTHANTWVLVRKAEYVPSRPLVVAGDWHDHA